MSIKRTIGAAFAALLLAGSAHAASLSIVGGTPTALPADYNPAPPVPGTGPGTMVLSFAGGEITGGGLLLDVATKLTYTFLGKQANAQNYAVAIPGGETLSNKGPVGASISANDDGGFVDFLFRTLSGNPPQQSDIVNGVGVSGPLGSKLNVAFLLESSRSALAFFGDGRGDVDHDDMVIRISVVPLPAGGLLLLTALGGFVAVRRRRKTS